jgi:hypothetical protein
VDMLAGIHVQFGDEAAADQSDSDLCHGRASSPVVWPLASRLGVADAIATVVKLSIKLRTRRT